MVEIIVVKRKDDYLAAVAGHPNMKATGDDYYSAIGYLVASHQKTFGIENIKQFHSDKLKKTIENSIFGTPVDNIPNTLVGNTNINTDRKFG